MSEEGHSLLLQLLELLEEETMILSNTCTTLHHDTRGIRVYDYTSEIPIIAHYPFIILNIANHEVTIQCPPCKES